MDDVKCPACRGRLVSNSLRDDDGGIARWLECVDCAWSPVVQSDTTPAFGELQDACRHLAHWEPRDRLPTPEEEAAHRARHGEGAVWMGRHDDGHGRGWSEWYTLRMREHYDGRVIYPLDCGIRWQSYPVTPEGRPVAWPEVSNG